MNFEFTSEMNFKRNYKVTVEDESHLSEVMSFKFSIPLIITIGIVSLILLLAAAGLIVSVTPLRTLLPGYMKASERSETEENLLRLDSLMAAYEIKSAYIDNFLKVTNINRIPQDSIAVKHVSRELNSDSLMEKTEAERNFVSQMEEHERFNVSVIAPLAAENMLFYPVSSEGIFTKDSQKSPEGVVILPRDINVQSAADGVVIALYYSAPEHGYVVVVQHKRGFVTSYTHVGNPLVEVGDIVNAGQIIAFAPNPDSKGTRSFTVRMWHNGLPIIPYDYLGNPTPETGTAPQFYESPRGRL